MKLVENVDFYFNDQGLMVLTAKFHLERGHCCGKGCKHCPFQYMNVPDDERRQELILQQQKRDNETL